jgi:hypothetical protein
MVSNRVTRCFSIAKISHMMRRYALAAGFAGIRWQRLPSEVRLPAVASPPRSNERIRAAGRPKPCCFQPLMDFCAQQAETAICDDCGQRLVVRLSEGSCGLVSRHNLSEVRANSSRGARKEPRSSRPAAYLSVCNPFHTCSEARPIWFLEGNLEAGGRDAGVISPFPMVDRDAAGAGAVLRVPRSIAHQLIE